MRKILPLYLIIFYACQSQSDTDQFLKSQIILELNERNNLMAEFVTAEFINPVRYREYRLYAKEVNEATNNLLKLGQKPESISFKSDSIKQYFDLLNSVLAPNQNTHSYLQEQKKISMELCNKLKGDVSAVLPLQLSIVLSQNYCLQNLLEDPTRHEFTFNKVYPVVIEDKKILERGETYTARILMAAVDTLTIPVYKVDGEMLESNVMGQGVLNIETHKKGIFNWDGEVIWMNDNDGIQRVFNVGSEFTVK